MFFECPEYSGFPVIRLRPLHLVGQGRHQQIALWLHRLQRVGQEDLQTFLIVQRMALVAQVLRQLQMSDGVRRDQVFEAIDVLRQVLAHDAVGLA